MMAAADVDKLVIVSRFEKGASVVAVLLYLPLGVLLTVVRCFIFLHALLLCYLLANVAFVKNVVVRVMLMVCGVVVTTAGDLHTDRRAVLVANHMTSLDPFILSLVLRCVLVAEGGGGRDMTLLCSHLTLSPHLNKEERTQSLKQAIHNSALPVLLFPEGGRVNNSYGLLKFRLFPFQLDAPIQPIGITARRCFFNVNISTVNSPWWLDLLITFFLPFTFFRIKYFPLTECRDSETSEQFAERVQSNLARGLNVTPTSLTLSDLTEFVKNGRRLATHAPSPSPSPPSQEKTTRPLPASQENTSVVEDVTSADPSLNVMLRQVRDVLPKANPRAVLHDLEKTRDVDSTITNILEGRVTEAPPTTPPPSPSTHSEADQSTFKATSFPKSAPARHLSLQERKQAMLEAARQRYKEKHGIP